MLKKYILSKDGATNKGYMTNEEHVYNQNGHNKRWTIDEAEQTFSALLEEAKIERIKIM